MIGGPIFSGAISMQLTKSISGAGAWLVSVWLILGGLSIATADEALSPAQQVIQKTSGLFQVFNQIFRSSQKKTRFLLEEKNISVKPEQPNPGKEEKHKVKCGLNDGI